MLFEYLRKFLSRHKVCRHVLGRTAVVHIYPLTAHSVRHCKYPAGGKGIRKPGYKPLGIREMRKRIIYYNGVKGFTEVELFNIPANEMNILCLMGFDSDFNHFRRDIYSRYGCDFALKIVRYKHSRAAGDIQHPAAGFYSGVIKDLIYYRFAPCPHSNKAHNGRRIQ